MFNVSTLKSRVDDLRKDTTSGTIDTNDIINSVNGVIDELRGDMDLSTSVNSKYFYYLADKTDYSITNVIGATDFSNVKDIRVAHSQPEDFDYMTGNDFARMATNVPDTIQWPRNAYAVENMNGDDILRVVYTKPLAKSALHLANSYSNNGTWTADTTTSDAVTVATDTAEWIEYSGSVKFDIDVSQSVNNQADIAITDMTAVDLSGDSLYQRARIRMWIYIPTPTYTTGFTLRWGSSNTVYWSKAITAPANGGSFVAGWNELEFDWSTASSTGSPGVTDAAAIDYMLLRVSYSASQADDTGVRFNSIVAYEPKRLETVYYSKYWVDNGTGTKQEYVTTLTGSERILVPGSYLEFFALGTVADIFDQQDDAAEDAVRYRARFERMKDKFKAEVGVTKNRKGNARFRLHSPWPTF